jgi:hypothetical protein
MRFRLHKNGSDKNLQTRETKTPRLASFLRKGDQISWKIQAAGVIALGMTMAGCAEFPKNGANQYTVLTFTVTLNAPIPVSSGNIYGIVINLAQGATIPSLPSPLTEMAPVLGTASQQQGSSLNGMFTGLATNALIITNIANTANPVGIYYFDSTAVDTGNLALPGAIGYTNDQLLPDSNGNITAPLTFTVLLNQLQPVNTQSYQWIQFQVVTMNKTALSGSSGRYIDALGISPSFKATDWWSIGQSTTYGMLQLYPEGLTGDSTPGGDAPISIQSVSLTVSVP